MGDNKDVHTLAKAVHFQPMKTLLFTIMKLLVRHKGAFPSPVSTLISGGGEGGGEGGWGT